MTAKRTGAPRSLRSKLLLQALLWPLLLLAGEFAYRTVNAMRGQVHDPITIEAKFYHLADAVETPMNAYDEPDSPDAPSLYSPRIPSPLYAWCQANSLRMLTQRAAYFQRRDPAKTFEIVVVGGSVAGGFGAYGSERLTELLEASPVLEGREVHVTRLGSGGYKQPQQLNLISFAIALGWKPDAVLNIDGFNEAAIGYENASIGAHPLYPSISHWGHLLAIGRADDDLLRAMWELREARKEPRRLADIYANSAILKRSAILTSLHYRLAWSARHDFNRATIDYIEAMMAVGSKGLFGPNGPTEFPEVIELSVQGWYENSLSLHSICGAAGIHYVHVLQPTLHDAGSKPLTESEINGGNAGPTWLAAAPLAYPAMRAAGQRLVDQGVHFIGGSMAFEAVTDPLYTDVCHFNELGNRILAEHVAPGFLESLSH